jgi:hypothetical protein
MTQYQTAVLFWLAMIVLSVGLFSLLLRLADQIPALRARSARGPAPVAHNAKLSEHLVGLTQEAAAALVATMAAIKEVTAADSPAGAQATPMSRDGSFSAKPLPSLAAIKAALNPSRDASPGPSSTRSLPPRFVQSRPRDGEQSSGHAFGIDPRSLHSGHLGQSL